MNEPEMAQKGPYAVELEADKRYFWCRCGRSDNQPFCDGSHAETGFTPIAFVPEKSGTYYLCGCKRTGDTPYCDGTHKAL